MGDKTEDARGSFELTRGSKMTPTQAQTFAMLALDRGASPEHLPPRARRSLLERRWIDRESRLLTDSGREAMIGSAHLVAATKELDAIGDPSKALALRVIITGASLEVRQRNRRRAAIASVAMRRAAAR